MSTAASSSSGKVAIIICSTRNPRSGPEVAEYVRETLAQPVNEKQLSYTLHLVDIKDFELPLFDEPVIPAQITDPSGYAHEHTRRWSREISQYAGYIFVTPQYNWGYPAALKNALDYLFNEWKGKPAAIVSYGGHGGGKCAAQLRGVLHGLRMQVAETMPALTFGPDGLMAPQQGKALGVTGPNSSWNQDRGVVLQAARELNALLNKRASEQMTAV